MGESQMVRPCHPVVDEVVVGVLVQSSHLVVDEAMVYLAVQPLGRPGRHRQGMTTPHPSTKSRTMAAAWMESDGVDVLGSIRLRRGRTAIRSQQTSGESWTSTEPAVIIVPQSANRGCGKGRMWVYRAEEYLQHCR
jgi:hypothetical protein